VISKVWKGESVAVLATGPSLTIPDIQACYRAGLILVGVNSCWMMAPYVDVIYAGDYRYWKAYAGDIDAAGIQAKRFSRSSRAQKDFGATYAKTGLGQDYNSGELAVELAIRRGARTIAMLGFDASVKNGLHCHGAHQKTPNPTPERSRRWLKQFDRIRKHYPDANVVNCSRETRITSIARMDLGEYLAGIPESKIRSARQAGRVSEGDPPGWAGML
jgi:hypothetical protein